jgi:hypothetical protein
MLGGLPMPLAWFGFDLAYLAWPDLIVDPNSKILSTYKPGRYTSQVKIIQIAQ